MTESKIGLAQAHVRDGDTLTSHSGALPDGGPTTAPAPRSTKTPQQVCTEIAEDMAADAAAFDGRTFSGCTIGEYFGNQGAAIAALAHLVKELYDKAEPQP